MDGIMSTKPTRTKRPSTKRKQASPSLTSLFSSVTKTSASSSGSNSTVTPKTFQRQRQLSQLATTENPIPEPSKPLESDKPASRPNVFAFMDNGAEEKQITEESDALSQDEHDSSPEFRQLALEVHAQQPVTPLTRRGDRRTSSSLHSDSGISVNSISPDLDKTPRALAHITNPRSSLENAYHQTNEKLEASVSNSLEPLLQSRMSKRDLSAASHRPHVFIADGRYQHLPPDPGQPIPAITDSRLKHLARHVSVRSDSSNPPPIYRRFEHLTNQLLIQLQTELATIESDIAALDATISKPSKAPIRRHPHLPTDELRWQRAQLLSAAGSRLDAYHRLLASYDKLAQLPQASADDIDLHRRFLHLPNFPVGREFEYLDQIEDVINVAGARNGGARFEQAFTDARTLAVGMAALMTILAIRSVPSLLARIALGGLVEGGMLAAGLLPRLPDADATTEACVYGVAALVVAAAVS